jgi:hypothetical protein
LYDEIYAGIIVEKQGSRRLKGYFIELLLLKKRALSVIVWE